jgi:hypothetical protein
MKKTRDKRPRLTFPLTTKISSMTIPFSLLYTAKKERMYNDWDRKNSHPCLAEFQLRIIQGGICGFLTRWPCR